MWGGLVAVSSLYRSRGSLPAGSSVRAPPGSRHPQKVKGVVRTDAEKALRWKILSASSYLQTKGSPTTTAPVRVSL